MQEDINTFVKAYEKCARSKTTKSYDRAPLQPIKAIRPMQIIHTDLSGPYPETERGNKYILTFIDHFTKYVEQFAIPEQTN